MEISPDELFMIIGKKEVELIIIRSDMAKKDELLKALEKNPAGKTDKE